MNLQDIQCPVWVQSRVLNLNLLPDWRSILEQLPVGCGIKGGVARKILKVISGLKRKHADFAAEFNGNGDIDVLVAVTNVSPDIRFSIRQHFAGMTFGEMVLQAKDIEVSDSLEHYFLTRDVTINEALAFRHDPSTVILYFTEQAHVDVNKGFISPAVHCLHTGFMQNWQWDNYGNVIIAPKLLSRCILRWLKGHGLVYGISNETWHYYREIQPLTPRHLFRIFRHFVDDDEAFKRSAQHLADLGLIDRTVDLNRLWGTCLFETNEALAQQGRRLTLCEPDAEQIEAWISHKEDEYEHWLYERQTKQALQITVEPEFRAEVVLPDGLQNFPAFFSFEHEAVSL